MHDDLRDWLKKVEAIGKLKRIGEVASRLFHSSISSFFNNETLGLPVNKSQPTAR